jgi:hypothetical protein
MVIGKMYEDILTVTMNVFLLPTGASFVTYMFTTQNEKDHTTTGYSENFIPMSQKLFLNKAMQMWEHQYPCLYYFPLCKDEKKKRKCC